MSINNVSINTHKDHLFKEIDELSSIHVEKSSRSLPTSVCPQPPQATQMSLHITAQISAKCEQPGWVETVRQRGDGNELHF